MSQTKGFSSTDKDELLRRETNILKELSNKSEQDYGWRKQKISELKEVAILRMEAGTLEIKKNDIASYIWKRLTDYNIKLDYSGFIRYFTDDEKRSYSGTNFESGDLHIWKVLGEYKHLGKVEICTHCDARRFDGVIYEPQKLEEKKESESQNSSSISEEETKYNEPTDILLDQIKQNSQHLASVADDLRDKCHLPKGYKDLTPEEQKVEIKKAESVSKAVIDGFGGLSNVKHEITELRYLDARLAHIDTLTDFRQRLGAFEKVKARLFITVAEHLHQCGKSINISAKHLKNDVKDNDEIIKNLERFRICNLCGGNMYDDFNLQVKQVEKGLEPRLAIPIKSKK